MEFKDNLKVIREFRGKKKSDVANDLGIRRQNLTNWEAGPSEPGSDILDSLSKVLRVPRELFYKKDLTEEYLEKNFSDDNITPMPKPSDNNGNLDPEEDRVLRELIERNDKYRLVPTIILTEYEILSKNEIASRESLLQELIASQRVVIASKNDVITELKKEIDLLKSGQILLPPKQAEKDLAVRNT